MDQKRKGGRLFDYTRKLRYRISLDRKTFIIYSVLRGLVILTLIRMLMTRSYEGAMICILCSTIRSFCAFRVIFSAIVIFFKNFAQLVFIPSVVSCLTEHVI